MKRQAGFTMYLMIGMIAVMGAMSFAGWLYYKDTQATIANLTAKNVALVIQVEEDKLIIAQQKEDAALQKIVNTQLNEEFHKSRVQVEDLRGVLKKRNEATGKTRDIGKLAIHRPGTISKILTNGTSEALRCIELASGAEHTADELAATKKSQINDLCTELANPSYIPH